MLFLIRFVLLLTFIYTTYAAILKSSMNNNYPQVAVLGCDSNKANLYYDVQRQVWVEHLISPCVNNEQSILEFCQQAYPSLNIGNIVRLETVLRFENWCELLPPVDNNISRCKDGDQSEEVVQPFRCLHVNSQREETTYPTLDCTINRINQTGQCLRPEKWQQYAALDCTKKSMVLNSSIITLDWCGLSAFRGVEYICCPQNDISVKTEFETGFADSVDDLLKEDDPVQDFVIVPKTSTMVTHRKIIAMSLASREPNWMEDYRQWNSDRGYFSDDEDTNDDQEEIKLSSPQKSHLTLSEHERFTKEKQDFRRKYQQKIDDLKSRWQNQQDNIKSQAKQNPTDAQRQYERTEIEYRQEYETIKQAASQERTRINEVHENNLDQVLDAAKEETNQKLITAWNEQPLKPKTIQEALYNYVHVLLRDRIHLVNRYERLRAVDPLQAERKRVSIHERLRSIADKINQALTQLQRDATIQSEVQSEINELLLDYDEVNQAADKLVSTYMASLSTTSKPRILPLGRDEKKIYPFSKSPSNKVTNDDNDANSEYNYDTEDDYDDDDDDSATKGTNNADPVEVGDSNWDVDVDSDATFDVKLVPTNDEQA
ncbi:unnamed protein product, partial [Adineta ricciae]